MEQLKPYQVFILIALWFIICLSAVIAVVSIDEPWVLGSERNADGSIEYLCLGRGCEDL